MNIYEKLQMCRVELQQSTIKKSGTNKFANFNYFELSDFLPTINELMKKHKLSSVFNLNENNADLTIINTEKPEEQITFSCYSEIAEMTKIINVQKIGATVTYLRRYLYMNAFEIVEHDVLNSVSGHEEVKPQEPKATKKQVIEITDLADFETTKSILKAYKVDSLDKLNKKQAESIIKRLKERQNAENSK